MADATRCGVIGCGVIGVTHAEAISALPDATLVAVADPDLDRARALAGRFEVAAHRDLASLLARERLDLVSICTPSGTHGALACAAMRAGCHVLVEKPIEVTLPAIDAMLRVQRETGMVLGGVFQHRFDPASQTVYRLIRDGAFGTVALGSAQLYWWRSQGYYDSGAWRGTWEMDGGGVLMNQTIHTIDLLLWMLGPVESVQATTATVTHTMEVEDTAVATLRFVSGALGSIAATTCAYPGMVTRLELFGDRGSATIEDDRLVALRLAGEEDVGVAPATVEAAPAGANADPAAVGLEGHVAQIADMVAALRDGRPPLVDGEAARRPVELILAIYEAARTGREVRLT